MRRLTPLLLTLLLAAGCSVTTPPGTDGDLGNHWPVFGEPASVLPKVGDCLITRYSSGLPQPDTVIDCTASHAAEIVYFGSVPDLDSPPEAGSDHLTEMWRECDRQASAYVGRDWADGMLRLKVTLASLAAWQAGSRWFRCDLVYIEGFYDNESETARGGSLKGAMPAALLIGCLREKSDDSGYIESVTRVACTSPHNAEYGGSLRADRLAYPEQGTNAAWQGFYDTCDGVLAGYLGVSRSTMAKLGNMPAIAAVDAVQWTSGQHLVRCYLWAPRDMTKSARGGHGAGIAHL